MILTKESSVAVIGAGLSGLAAGCYSLMNGYRTVIYEQGPRPGGTASWWRRGPYLFDGGIQPMSSFAHGSHFSLVCDELGIAGLVPLQPVTLLARITDPSGDRRVDITGDIDGWSREFMDISSLDAPFLARIARAVMSLDRWDTPAFGTLGPPELRGPGDFFRDLRVLRRHWKIFTGHFSRPVREHACSLADPWLGACLTAIGGPDAPLWHLVFLLSMLRKGELVQLAEGCENLVSALEYRFRALGGQIRFNSRVTRILHEGGRAFGVGLENGSTAPAAHVISAADGRSTIFGMLGDFPPGRGIRGRYDTWKTATPRLLVSFGIKKSLGGRPSSILVVPDGPIPAPGGTVDFMRVRVCNYSPRFAPRGRTVVQAQLPADFDFWNELRSIDSRAYLNRKKEASALCLELLDSVLPGTADAVETADCATPATCHRFTGNSRGAWTGWDLDTALLTTPIGRTVPGLANFYMAGHWVVPGSAPTVMASGRHAVQLACHTDRKAFIPSLPPGRDLAGS